MLNEVQIGKYGFPIICKNREEFQIVTVGNPELIIQGESMFE